LDACCGPLIDGSRKPSGPEALMRSRYSAYTQGAIDYLSQTLAPEAVEGFNPEDAKEWSSQAQWQGLDVRRVAENDDVGEVEFVAKF
jgi:SEC-C motif-containing protein